ncbi:TolC family protein [Candidatus Sumerlaeota bacterium]|nr:TolC family protein [Candidatus Sumerlaeota bacterium]
MILSGVLLILSGCRGVPTKGEKLARQQKEEVASAFRPGGQLPTLPTLSPTSSLDDFLRYSVLRHPRVEASYYEWAASIERISVARSLPDPVFTVGLDVQKGLEEDVASMVMALMGGVMTELPGPGKLRARADLQTEESKSRFAQFQQASIETALGARIAYYDLFLVQKRIAVTKRNLSLVRDIEESARRRSEAGLSDLQDVLQAESDVARLENDLANLKDQQVALTAAWKSALGIAPSESDPPIPQTFQFTATDGASTATLAQILQENPRLRVMQAEISRAEAEIAVAYKSRVPDFTLGIEAEAPTTAGSRNPRDTIWKPRLGVTAPIWRDRIAAEIADAEAMGMAARANYSAEQLELAREFALNGFGIREASRNLEVLRNRILPRQHDIVELAQRGYQGDVTTFFELIGQQRRLIELELLEAESVAARERMIGELNLALAGHGWLETAVPTGGATR